MRGRGRGEEVEIKEMKERGREGEYFTKKKKHFQATSEVCPYVVMLRMNSKIPRHEI